MMRDGEAQWRAIGVGNIVGVILSERWCIVFERAG